MDTIEVGKPHSDLIDIVQGEYYYIEAQLRHKEGNEVEPKLALSLWLTETTLHNSHSKWAADELWALYIEYERKLETQTFEFIDMPSSAMLTSSGNMAICLTVLAWHLYPPSKTRLLAQSQRKEYSKS